MDIATKDLIAMHEAMAVVLDTKFSNVPEWKAFRLIDRALLSQASAAAAPAPPRQHEGAPVPYMTLAYHALTESGAPLSTGTIVEYITARRPVSGDRKKVRIVVQSSLSKDKRFTSILWRGGRGWWFADRAVPGIEAADARPAA